MAITIMYLAKFLDILLKLFFPCNIVRYSCQFRVQFITCTKAQLNGGVSSPNGDGMA